MGSCLEGKVHFVRCFEAHKLMNYKKRREEGEFEGVIDSGRGDSRKGSVSKMKGFGAWGETSEGREQKAVFWHQISLLYV